MIYGVYLNTLTILPDKMVTFFFFNMQTSTVFAKGDRLPDIQVIDNHVRVGGVACSPTPRPPRLTARIARAGRRSVDGNTEGYCVIIAVARVRKPIFDLSASCSNNLVTHRIRACRTAALHQKLLFAVMTQSTLHQILRLEGHAGFL